MEQHVDFAALADEVERAAPRPSRDCGGRPPFPTELMVRVLLFQQLFNLSDEQMEFQLLDLLSFQRFVGLRSSSQIPERTRIWTFKERLIQAGASESIFEAVNRELSKPGYIARGGQMVDASIVQAPKQALRKSEKALGKENAMPSNGSLPSVGRRTWTRTGPRSTASPTLVTRSRPTPTIATSWYARSR